MLHKILRPGSLNLTCNQRGHAWGLTKAGQRFVVG